MMRERKKADPWLRLTAFLLALVLLLVLTWFLGWLLMPQRKSYGSMWEQYRQEPRDSVDVLFFGSSVVYCDVAPAWIWEESGLSSWVMAGPEQTLSLTYYYLREALKTQTPEMVVVEVTGLLFDKYQNYSRANISTMPFSLNRLAAVFRAAEASEWKGLLFPLYNYHARWTDVERPEMEEHLRPSRDLMAGYTPLGRVLPQNPRINNGRVLNDETYAENLRWLARIRDLCRDRDIRLLIYLAPAAARTPLQLTERIDTDAEALGIEMLDLSDLSEELEVDYEQDWYDPLHFNIRGAEKFSRWWGIWLASELAPVPVYEEKLWEQRLEAVLHKRDQLLAG